MKPTKVNALLSHLINKVWSLFKTECEERDAESNKQQENKVSTTYEILIMSVSRSGKSTLFQQLVRMHIDGGKFNDKTRMRRRNKIRRYVIDYLIEVLTAIPSQLTSLRNMAFVKWLLDNIKTYNFDKSFDHTFYQNFNLQDLFDSLWKDQMLKDYLRVNDISSSKDNIEYFLGRIRTILERDYIPTDEDILKCPIFSTNVAELHLDLVKSDFCTFRFVDTGREQCLKILSWVQLREKFIQRNAGRTRDCIIFLVDCSSPEQFSESLKMLRNLYIACRFYFVMICVVLNKRDVLKKYISSGGSLECFFGDFANFPAFMSSFSVSITPRSIWKQKVERRIAMAVTFFFKQVQCVEYPFHKRMSFVSNSGVTNEDDVKQLMKEFLQIR